MSEDNFFRNELATLLEYSTLLKKKRSAEAEELVQQILQEEKNIIARINRIKALDEQYRESSKEQIIPLPSSREIEKIQVPSPKRTSFFTYFFSLRKILTKMCHDNSLLVPKFFGMKFHLSHETISLLEEIRTNVFHHILPVLQKILENGWKILNPSKYNIFYYLYNFFNDFLQKFVIEKKDIGKNFEFICSFADPFFTLVSNKEYLQDIREGIYVFYSNKENEEMANFLFFIEGIMDRKKTFSFINYILMIYSIYYRKPISLSKILEIREIEPIPTSKYLTIQKVKHILQDYLRQLQAKQKINEKKLFYLKHIADENPIILQEFIRENHNSQFKLDFFNVDLLKSCEDFLKSFLKYSYKILIDELHLYKQDQVKISPVFQIVWENFLGRLDALQKEIEYQRDLNKHLFISLSTYDKFLIQHRHLESEKDEKLCSLIDKILEEFFPFFEVLTQLIYNDYYLTYYETKENTFDKLKTRNKPITDKSEERFLPFADFQIEEYKGETVSDVLTRIATITGTFLYILNYKKIEERLKEKSSLIEISKNNLEQIMRLSF